jgi:hypothetical protein
MMVMMTIRPARVKPDSRDGFAVSRFRGFAVDVVAAPQPRNRATAQPEGLSSLIEKLQKSRPLIATYVGHATSGKKEGGKIVWTFDDQTFADYVNDAKATIEQLATELYGEKMTIETKLAGTQPQESRRVEDKPSALREDPVMKAFQKHLGGEIVESRRSK